MDPIQEAIEYIKSREAGDKFSYRQVAKKFGVNRTTLSRRHKGSQQPRGTEAAEHRRNLNPQQEDELISYIQGQTRAGVPPTRSILKNFGSVIAQHEVSDSWVTRLQHRYPDELISKWDTGMDRERHLADNKRKCKLYFDLLHSKMQEHEIEERNTYNMDEKGFFVGVANRRKRIFSKAVWESRERTQVMRDGNREWITLLACVCASGDALPPALIYQGTSGVQLSWVHDLLETQNHQIFISHSASGWSNNDLGLAWLQQVFERHTAAKARR
jgi:transcriptional regulator with XRE-family HTH domain